MDPLRVQKTQLHHQIGIFRYSQMLNQCGVTGPARQIRAIGRFIELYLGPATELPLASNRHQLGDWALRGLGQIATDPGGREPCTLSTLAVRALPVVVWDPYPDFAELLNFSCGNDAYSLASRRLRSRSFAVEENALWALVAEFLPRYLPRALKSFDCSRGQDNETFWLARVFFRFALKTLVTDRANLHQLETLAEPALPTRAPWEEEEDRRLITNVAKAVESIPPRLREAVDLYFGFRGEPQTFRQIAANLECSEHLARAAVVQGLASVASRLGAGGVLDERELELARLMFVEGMSSGMAAERMGIPKRQARTLTASIGAKMRRGLRARTSTPRLHTVQTKGEIMQWLTNDEPSVSNDELVAALMDLREPPVTENDPPIVRLAGHRVPLARIHAILGDEDIAQRLQERGIDLGWAFDPNVRADLEATEWDQALEQLSNRIWRVVEFLYHLCLQGIQEQARPTPEMAREELLQRLHRVLCGLARTLEGTMSRAIRRSESPILRLNWTNDDVLCHWEQEESGAKGFSLRQIVVSRTEELGDVPPTVADVLPDVMMDALREGSIQIPAFRRTEDASPDGARLTWIKPILEDRLEAKRSLPG